MATQSVVSSLVAGWVGRKAGGKSSLGVVG
jgi:hypothetical protein